LTHAISRISPTAPANMLIVVRDRARAESSRELIATVDVVCLPSGNVRCSIRAATRSRACSIVMPERSRA
jgi:hypothetical protein